MLSVTAYLRRAGLAKGIYGGNPAWRNVFVALSVLKLVRPFITPTPQVLTREALKPGQSMEITAIDPKVVRRSLKQAAAESKAAEQSAKAEAKATKRANRVAAKARRAARRDKRAVKAARRQAKRQAKQHAS